jgi:hypothetical protein
VLFADAVYCLPDNLMAFDCPPCASLKGFQPYAVAGDERE